MTRPIEKVLARLSGVTPAGEGWKATCPVHAGGNEKDPSLSVGEGDNGGVVLNCFAEGCGAGEIARAIGLEVRDLFPEGPPKASGRTSRPRLGQGGGDGTTPAERVTLRALGERCGLDPQFLTSLGLKDSPRGVVVPYLGEAGEHLHDKLRTALSGKGKYRYAGKGTKAVPYGLWRLAKIREGYRALVLVEGESDCWTLWRHGMPALGIPGASNYSTLAPSHVEGIEKVFVVQEPGPAGEVFVAGVSQRLAEVGWQGAAYVVRMPEGSKDPNELHKADPKRFPQAFRECCERGTPLGGPTIDDMFVVAAEVEERPVEFLWYPYLVAGELNILMGKPGDGKGQLSLAIAAAVSRGGLLPGSVLPVDARDVLLFSPEDAVDKVVVPRLRTSGADLSRVRIFRFREHAFTFGEEDRSRLELAIERWRPGLVVFDPVVAFMEEGTDVYKATQVRTALQPVHRIMERTGTCGLLVAHLRKGSVGAALDGLFGSVDFGAIVRSALGVYPDRQADPEEGATKGILAHVKHNLSAAGRSLGFEVRANPDRTSSFRWTGEHRWDAEELAGAAGEKEGRNAFAEACELLTGLLHGGEEVNSSDIIRAATNAGLSKSTLDRARKHLGYDWRRIGWGPGSKIVWFQLRDGERYGQRREDGAPEDGAQQPRGGGRAPF